MGYPADKKLGDMKFLICFASSLFMFEFVALYILISLLKESVLLYFYIFKRPILFLILIPLTC